MGVRACPPAAATPCPGEGPRRTFALQVLHRTVLGLPCGRRTDGASVRHGMRHEGEGTGLGTPWHPHINPNRDEPGPGEGLGSIRGHREPLERVRVGGDEPPVPGARQESLQVEGDQRPEDLSPPGLNEESLRIGTALGRVSRARPQSI